MDTVADPMSELLPRLMVNDIVEPATLPLIVSTPTGELTLPEKTPVTRFSATMSSVCMEID